VEDNPQLAAAGKKVKGTNSALRTCAACVGRHLAHVLVASMGLKLVDSVIHAGIAAAHHRQRCCHERMALKCSDVSGRAV
jgi:hypothetical protein